MRSHHPFTQIRTRAAARGPTPALAYLACVGFAAVSATVVLPSPADAATTWRCGNAYADTPCPGGRRIDTDTAPSDAARRAADEATRRIESRADAMERDRLQAERAALANVRLADAQRREAARQTAQQAAQNKREGARRSGGQAGKGRHAAAKDFIAQAPGGKKTR
jgi:hypothetical protein